LGRSGATIAPAGLARLSAAAAVSGPCTAHRLRLGRGRRRRSNLPPPSPASGLGCKRSIATHWYGAPWPTHIGSHDIPYPQNHGRNKMFPAAFLYARNPVKFIFQRN
jgi:hypothetical protein